MENFTTTITNTTHPPYIMDEETKIIICISLGLFVMPIIIILLILVFDLLRDYLGIQNFDNGILMSGNRKRKGFRKPSIIIEHLEIEEDCPICMEKLTGKLGHMDCKHYFHKECLDKWVKMSKNNDCPICRKS